MRELTVAGAERQAKHAAQEAIDGTMVHARARYCDREMARVPKYAATHVWTEVAAVATDPTLVEPIARALARLPGVVDVGMYTGAGDGLGRRPHVWVLRDIEED
jgi:hypothetical protein